MSISREEMNPEKYKLTPEQEVNQVKLHYAINEVRKAYGKPMRVTSGVRDIQKHKKIYLDKGVPEDQIPMGSSHLKALALDIEDSSCNLWNWCLKNLTLLKKLGLYLEDKRWTKNWVHFQLLTPASGKRIFVPNLQPATSPNIWDGKYPKEFDN